MYFLSEQMKRDLQLSNVQIKRRPHLNFYTKYEGIFMYRLALEGFIRNLIGNTCTLLVSWIFLCKVLRTRQCDT